MLAGQNVRTLTLRSMLDVAFVLVVDEAGGPTERARVEQEISDRGTQVALAYGMRETVEREWGMDASDVAEQERLMRMIEGDG